MHEADPKARLRTARPTILLASRTDLFDLVLHADWTDALSPSQRKPEQSDETGRIGGVITSHVERRQSFGIERVRRLARDDGGAAFVQLERDVARHVRADGVDEGIERFLQGREPLAEVH